MARSRSSHSRHPKVDEFTSDDIRVVHKYIRAIMTIDTRLKFSTGPRVRLPANTENVVIERIKSWCKAMGTSAMQKELAGDPHRKCEPSLSNSAREASMQIGASAWLALDSLVDPSARTSCQA
mmetsp:Transcript_26206/g.47874  ORF Transcript_26206/g.47874 Transcript_26206/m.47874 type:complete len:123 (-) Transcript_26206:145-513(-)